MVLTVRFAVEALFSKRKLDFPECPSTVFRDNVPETFDMDEEITSAVSI